MQFIKEDIVWQEVPNEVSLSFLISGCPLRCKGCHSKESWHPKLGTLLTPIYLTKRLEQYEGLLSCVLFMGGEWESDSLLDLLKIVHHKGLHSCLYTGLTPKELPPTLLPYLTYLKTGRWIEHLGGLNSPTTNQRFIDLRNKTCLNHLFLSKESMNDSLTA